MDSTGVLKSDLPARVEFERSCRLPPSRRVSGEAGATTAGAGAVHRRMTGFGPRNDFIQSFAAGLPCRRVFERGG
jgi:hypothetical protein